MSIIKDKAGWAFNTFHLRVLLLLMFLLLLFILMPSICIGSMQQSENALNVKLSMRGDVSRHTDVVQRGLNPEQIRQNTSGISRVASATFRDSFSNEKKVWFDANPELGKIALDVRSRVYLSKQERKWLNSKPKIPVRIGDYPPFMFTANEKPQGLSFDYVQVMCTAFELNCQYVPGLSVTESIPLMQKAGGIAIQPSWQRTTEREKIAIFTKKPYILSPFVIFQRKGDNSIHNMNALINALN